MSDRMTDCAPRGGGPGLADFGRRTRAEMIAQYRAYYEHQKAEAEGALAVPDEDLMVTTYVGAIVMKDRKEVTS